MAQNNNNNKKKKEEEKNMTTTTTTTATTEFETSFKRYDNMEDTYRGIPLTSPHGSSIHDENNWSNGNDDAGVDYYYNNNNSKYNNNNNNNNHNTYSQNMATNKNIDDVINNWDKLSIEPFPNYVLENNKGAKKNETAMEVGGDINMDVDIIADMDDKNTDINDTNTYLSMPMPTQTQEEETIKTELEKCEYPIWNEGIDRFTNWLAKSKSPSSLMSLTKDVLKQLNQEKALFMTVGYSNDRQNNNNNKNDANAKALTYVRRNNLLLCRLVLSEYQISTFQIGVYLDKNNSCLLDIQELSGEHFTFAHFLHIFRSQLEQQGIIDASTPTPELDNYGMSMEINLDSFDEM